ncbi:cytochrome P450 [Rhodococcus sp. NPDC056960]|uniref:cytochrome P450 n=1 Tax=Rhodococcus sp. NPDC056960 TaxID=3345982 RepID=UPI0036289689
MDINLLDPAHYVDGQPYELYRHLRETDPVHWHEESYGGPGYFALTRYADIKAVETDSATFANAPTTLINDDARAGDETHQHLIFSDPPHHTEHRKFLSPELGVLAVRTGEDRLQELVHDIIDRVIEKGECDFVEDIAGRMASFVMADLIGLPREQSLVMFDAAATLASGADTSKGRGLEAATIMYQWADAARKERLENPRDDMLTRIAHGEVLGIPFDEFQFQLDFQLLVSAGSDTSRNVLATGMLRLFENPAQYRALVEDPNLVPQAVEEMLRFDPPIVFQRRTVMRDTEIGGVAIRKGQKVASYYGAANRDPAVFSDPDTFDIRRSPNPHLAFGAGRHFCLGTHLARAELVAMFTALVTRMPDLRATGDTVWHESPETPSVIGPVAIPVAFTPGVRLGSAALV